MKKYVASIIILIFSSLFIAGCGETLKGVVKDTQRIGKGIKTIVVREGQEK